MNQHVLCCLVLPPGHWAHGSLSKSCDKSSNSTKKRSKESSNKLEQDVLALRRSIWGGVYNGIFEIRSSIEKVKKGPLFPASAYRDYDVTGLEQTKEGSFNTVHVVILWN